MLTTTERRWHVSVPEHSSIYIEADGERVIGRIIRTPDNTFTAFAYSSLIGEFITEQKARLEVEHYTRSCGIA
jgi:hypothetical protein